LIRPVALAVAAGLALTAAPARGQEPPPAEDAQVVGTVVGGDGKPAAGIPVDIDYDIDNPFGPAAMLFTLGFGCLVPGLCSGTSNEAGDVTTDGNGRYQGPLPGSYVAGTETDTDWHVTAGRPPRGQQLAGPTSTYEFEVNIKVQEAPPLSLWEAEPQVTVDRWRATATVAAPPAGLAKPRLRLSTVTGGGRTVDALTSTVDLRSFELDATAGVNPVYAVATAFADVRVPHANGRTIYHQAASTPTMPVSDIALVPPSRRAPCSIVAADGSTKELETCAATDGHDGGGVYDPVQPAAGTTALPPSVTVSMPAAVDIADVFAYGCDAGCVVEVSADGTTWARLTNDPASSVLTPDFPQDGYLVASARPPVSARHVRVAREGGVNAIEVSAWPAAPPEPIPPAEPPATDPDTGAPLPPGAREEAGRSLRLPEGEASAGVVALAVLALVVAATGIGIVVGRRLGRARP
jgi:hypothetical protein